MKIVSNDNVIVVLAEENTSILTENVKKKLTEFVLHVFDDIRQNKTRVGRFCPKQEAINYINKYKD